MFVSTTAAVANVLPVAEVKADGFWAWLWQLIVGRFFTTNTKNSATANSQKIEEKSKKQVDVPLCKEINTEQRGIPLDEKKGKIVGSEDFSDKNRKIVVDSFAELKKKARFVSPEDAETEFTLNIRDFREMDKLCSYAEFNPLIKVCLLKDEVHFVSLKSNKVLKNFSLKDENFKEKYSESLVWLKNLEDVYNLVYSNVFSAGDHYRNGEKFIERPMTLQEGNSKDSLVFKPNFDCKIDFEIDGVKDLVVKSLELDNVNLLMKIKTGCSALDFDLRNCDNLKLLESVIENLDYDFKEDGDELSAIKEFDIVDE